jgi:hypothetical protein
VWRCQRRTFCLRSYAARPVRLARAAGRVGPAVPTIVFHGDRDTTVNQVNGDQVIAQSKAAAHLRTTVTNRRGVGRNSLSLHGANGGRSVLEQWVLHEAGHAWSGGSTAGSYTEPRGPDASREMMRFFLQCPPPVASRQPVHFGSRTSSRHDGHEPFRAPNPSAGCRDLGAAVPAGFCSTVFHPRWGRPRERR